MLVLNWAVFENVNLEDANFSSMVHLYAGVDFRNITKNRNTVMPGDVE